MENKDYDIAVLAAAVADFAPVITANEKIKKGDQLPDIKLRKTKDILFSLGEIKTDKQVLVGFALETNNEKLYALKKLKEKNADMIVLNSLKDPGAGFQNDTNKVTILKRNGQEANFETKSKALVAKDIVDSIIQLF